MECGAWSTGVVTRDISRLWSTAEAGDVDFPARIGCVMMPLVLADATTSASCSERRVSSPLGRPRRAGFAMRPEPQL